MGTFANSSKHLSCDIIPLYMVESKQDHRLTEGDYYAGVLGEAVDPGLPGVVTVAVSKLEPIESRKKSRLGSNLWRILPDVRDAVLKKGWYPKLLSDVRQGKKKAVVITTLGSLAIFVAAAGVELGLRHGQDLRVFDKLLKRGKKK